jgi:hypothetical protein
MDTPPQMPQTGALDHELAELRDAYIALVNQAVGADDLALADELAYAYDEDLRDLRAQRAVLAA